MNSPNNKPVFTMSPVKSSSVKAHGYDSAHQILAVQFNNGGIYHYSGVPKDAVDNLLKADSFGKALQSTIVGKFKHVKQDSKSKASL